MIENIPPPCLQDLPSYSGPDGFPGGGMVGEPNMVGGPFTTMEVRLMRQVSGFGFRIIGGEEEGSQVQYPVVTCVL